MFHTTACLKSQGTALAGGVRLEPSSAPLWAGLGSCAVRPKHQEYAFTRSLQLDPKSAHTWAALGRLYMESGARHLADTCFTQARSQEPADAATWAAMGALAGLSLTGEPCTTHPLLLHWCLYALQECNTLGGLLYYLALHLNAGVCRVCKNAADVAAGLVVCCWCAAVAFRLCLHVIWLGDSEVVLYLATKQGSTSELHASITKLQLLADAKYKPEQGSSCSCSYTESPNNLKFTTMLRTPTLLAQACQNGAGHLQELVTRQTSTSML